MSPLIFRSLIGSGCAGANPLPFILPGAEVFIR